MSSKYDQLVAGNCFGEISLTPSVSSHSSDTMNQYSNGIENQLQLNLPETFQCSMSELFDEARRFFKEKQETQTLHITYNDNLQFVALLKQAKIGAWKPTYTQDVGLLDVIGNHRKQAWISLGEMSKETAMEEYVKLLFCRSIEFRKYLEERREQKRQDQLRKENELQRLVQIEERRKQEDLRKQIQDALNQQTYSQFKEYAEKYCRGNQSAQEELIRQLQEEHFQQYLKQIYQQSQLLTKTTMENHQQQTANPQLPPAEAAPVILTIPPPLSNIVSTPIPSTTLPELPPLNPFPSSSILNQSSTNESVPTESSIPLEPQFESLTLNTPLEPIPSTNVPSTVDGQIPEDVENNATEFSVAAESTEIPNLALANMWTRKDMKEFKEQIRKEKDAVIKVGSGETVTVRVPTHEDGRCIFWEFSTDYYDIGFGVYFEWTKAQSNTVTVHVSDSSDEDEEGEDGANPEKKDIEKGNGKSTNKPPKPRQDEVVPICRRDCHEEVYAGSHAYPGEGIYLLKFDNSYSLWRSKTLYYRVYYSK